MTKPDRLSHLLRRRDILLKTHEERVVHRPWNLYRVLPGDLAYGHLPRRRTPPAPAGAARRGDRILHEFSGHARHRLFRHHQFAFQAVLAGARRADSWHAERGPHAADRKSTRLNSSHL